MKLRTRHLVLLAAPLFLLAIACSGDDDNTTAATATTANQPVVIATSALATRPAAVSTVAGQPTVAVTVQTGTGAGEACGLVTRQDVAAALGEAVGDPQGSTLLSQTVAPGINASVSSCEFSSTTTARSVSVSLWRLSGGSAPQFRQVAEQFLCAQKERVSGLGDIACWYDSDHRELDILKGGSLIELSIAESSGPNRTDALRNLAGKVIAKVP